jgi:hypothetical protein
MRKLLYILMLFSIISCVKKDEQQIISQDTENKIMVQDNNPSKFQEEMNSNILYRGLTGKEKTINLSELISEFETFCPNNNEISWKDVKILFPLYYEGSDIPPADILFLSNSIMVEISKFYSKNIENRFYQYSFNNNELTIKIIDARVNVSRKFEVEKYHIINGNVLSVGEENKIIIYNYRDGFYFGGFGFFSYQGKK